ncbi:hypothetical protein ACOZB2_32420, partial [Pantoea endophytica]
MPMLLPGTTACLLLQNAIYFTYEGMDSLLASSDNVMDREAKIMDMVIRYFFINSRISKYG